MEENTLFIIRALPGAGKSTFAEKILGQLRDGDVCTTDDQPGLYTYLDDGGVIFHGGEKVNGVPRIVLAHQANQAIARRLMWSGVSTVIIPNTNCQRWEFQPYLDLAEEFSYRVTVASLFDGGCSDKELAERNSHGVPLHVIATMRSRFEHDWKNADPRPPWERSGVSER